MNQAMPASMKPVEVTLTMPGSKSMSYRAILLAALSDGVSEINGLCLDEGIHTFIQALQQLGIVSQLDKNTHSCIIAGCNGKFPKQQATLNCHDDITTARFLLAACASTPGVYYFDGSVALQKKSLSELLTVLCHHDAHLLPEDANHLPVTLIGSDTIEGGEIIFNNTIPNQYISALLLIAPYARAPISFSILNKYHMPQIDMTCSMMAEFGVLVHRIHSGQFTVPVPQRYQARDYTVEVDLSLAAYFFAAAAITHSQVTIPSIKRLYTKQEAVKSLTLLEKMGCHVIETSMGITVKGPDVLKGIDISLHHLSDLFLIFTAIACFANSPSQISYIGVMKKREKQRMQAMVDALKKLGIQLALIDNGIRIFPSQPSQNTLSCHDDPKIGMALSLIGLKTPGISIEDTACVTRVFPEFFSLLKLWIKKA